MSSFGFYGKILISSAGVCGAFHDFMQKSSLTLERIKTCLWGWKCRTNYNGMINRTMQSAQASEQATTFQWLNPYKCILLLVQILGYWIHSVVANCHRVVWWLNISFPFFVCLFFCNKLYFLRVLSPFINIYTKVSTEKHYYKTPSNIYFKSICRKHNAFFHILNYCI